MSVSRSMACCKRLEVLGVQEVLDQRAVDGLDRVVDDVVLLGQAIDDRLHAGVAAQVREDRVVLERVVRGHDAAVARAERAQRPVVLAQRHLVEHRARVAGAERAVLDLRDQVAQLVELCAQHVVDVDQVLAGRAAAVGVGGVGLGRTMRPLGLVPRHPGRAAHAVVGRGRDAERRPGAAARGRRGGAPARCGERFTALRHTVAASRAGGATWPPRRRPSRRPAPPRRRAPRRRPLLRARPREPPRRPRRGTGSAAGRRP